ncbi:MAG: hypothetical protein AAFR98_06850 [Pseudomonadota bacterium]
MLDRLIETLREDPQRIAQDVVGMTAVVIVFFVGLHLPLFL